MCSECHSWSHLLGCPNMSEPTPIYTCKYCGEGIFVEDKYAEIDGNYYHADCLSDEMPIYELLDMFGVSVQMAQEDY